MLLFIFSLGMMFFAVGPAGHECIASDGDGDNPLEISVIHLEGCPAARETLQLVEKTAEELAVAIKLRDVVVTTDEEAKRMRHIGSPTVQINGLDIEPEARGVNQFGLS